MSDQLLRRLPGRLEVVDGKISLYAAGPNKPGEKKYDNINRSLIRPSGIPLTQLDGAAAEVTWHISDGKIESVKVARPETGPVIVEADEGAFFNPYGFVSIPDRDQLPEALADGPPAGHHRYQSGRWTGTIPITITTHTPLLLPNHEKAALAPAPAPLPVRVDHRGRPYLPGSIVKGMLRSAYEAITNSRFGIFAQDERLAIRATGDENVATRLYPAYITEVRDDSATAIASRLQPTGESQELAELTKPMQPAVWVPRELACRNGCRSTRGCRHPSGRHCGEVRGKIVEAWLYLARLGKSPLWRVLGYAEPGKLPPSSSLGSPPKDGKGPQPVAGYPLVRVRGRLHWTGSTLPPGGDTKHDERMFVEEVLEGPATVQLTHIRLDAHHIEGWQAVIDSYDRVHDHDPRRTRDYGDYIADPRRWWTLRVGDTLYVELDNEDQNEDKVIGLYPAMIGRKPFPGPPVTSLPESHRPATRLHELSPADRVFGWVRHGADESAVAHRGHLRVVPDIDGTPSKESVKSLETPLRLTVLNNPKPSQFRFYLGDAAGDPLGGKPDQGQSGKHPYVGVAKDPKEGYPAEPGTRRLRGRKVYLTHAEVLTGQPGADQYWTPPRRTPATPEPVEVAGFRRYREYAQHAKSGKKRRGAEEPDKVTTLVSQWVEPGSEFRLTLYVDELTGTELGALLWLLNLPEGAHLKLGLGKPLGFGAMRITMDYKASRFHTGEALGERYRTLVADPSPADPARLEQLKEEYDKLLTAHLPAVRKQFLHAARGFVGAPVHYPRTGGPETESFSWFVANDRVGRQKPGQQLPLGDLAEPEALLLPYNPSGSSKGQPPRPPRQRSAPGASGGRKQPPGGKGTYKRRSKR